MEIVNSVKELNNNHFDPERRNVRRSEVERGEIAFKRDIPSGLNPGSRWPLGFIRLLNKTLAFPLLVFIWVYQRTISPDHGLLRFLYPYGFCKFHPTCSVYSYEVIKQDGLAGLPKAIRRVLSCTPSSLGGVDLPPHQE